MPEALSPSRFFEGTPVQEMFRPRIQEILQRPAAMPAGAAASAVTAHLSPGARSPEDPDATAALSQVQVEARRGADMAGAHSGLDPQRVAKLLGLLD